jgi:hypothetical protein
MMRACYSCYPMGTNVSKNHSKTKHLASNILGRLA